MPSSSGRARIWTLHGCNKSSDYPNCQWYLEPSPSRSGAYYFRSAGGNYYLHTAGGTRTGASQTLHSCGKQYNYGHCQWLIKPSP